MQSKSITVPGGVKSISDDDLCAECHDCHYRPGEMSSCAENWPGLEDKDGYVQTCEKFRRLDCTNRRPQCFASFVQGSPDTLHRNGDGYANPASQ